MNDTPPDGPTPLARERFESLRALLGTWRGRGRGRFPTIDAFEFVEETTFTQRGEDELSLHYEQRAWVEHPDGLRAPSHWESGFFHVTDAGKFEVLNAQTSGRVEVLRGTLAVEQGQPPVLRLELTSVVHGHDPRVVATLRRLWLDGDELRYEVEMATDRVAERTLHLDALLYREGGASS